MVSRASLSGTKFHRTPHIGSLLCLGLTWIGGCARSALAEDVPGSGLDASVDNGPVDAPTHPTRRYLGFGLSGGALIYADGTVWSWGDRASGLLGDAGLDLCLLPCRTEQINDAVDAVSTAGTRCIASRSGNVTCWGTNALGELGIGSRSLTLMMPTMVPALTDVTALTAGEFHICALRGNGSVACWGGNLFGQVGSGRSSDSEPSPVEVVLPAPALQITAGSSMTCALLTDHRVACWGSNGHGELGDGTTTDRSTPVIIPSLADVLEVSAGADHVCARRVGGRVSCWGDNGVGGFCNGTTAEVSPTPLEIPSLEGANQLALGSVGTCAILAGGAVYCCGSNVGGALGDGSTVAMRSTLGRVSGLPATQQLRCATHACCALTTVGEVWCWGQNTDGALGDGTTTDRSVPAQVTALP
jgi:alpha-tubulin suppressor-like RCC1 family protein